MCHRYLSRGEGEGGQAPFGVGTSKRASPCQVEPTPSIAKSGLSCGSLIEILPVRGQFDQWAASLQEEARFAHCMLLSRGYREGPKMNYRTTEAEF